MNNNHIANSQIIYPLKLQSKKKIDYSVIGLRQLSQIGNYIYGYCPPGILFSIDKATNEIAWENGNVGAKGVPRFGNDGKVFISADRPLCLEERSGDIFWRSKEKGFILGETSDLLICRDIQDEKIEKVFCISKSNGEIAWDVSERLFGYLNNLACEGEFLLLEGGDGIHVCNVSTGKIVWKRAYKDIHTQHGQSENEENHKSLGPLVNGLITIGFSGEGKLLALDIKNGEILWEYFLQEKRCPYRIIQYDEKVYFNVNQGRGNDNYLTCVDLQGGLVFKTEGNFTPLGCRYPIITNNHLLSVAGNYISFFSLSEEKFVWQKDVKTNLGSVLVYDNFLVSHDPMKKEIYWFASN